jgi:hypothetical protein
MLDAITIGRFAAAKEPTSVADPRNPSTYVGIDPNRLMHALLVRNLIECRIAR